MQLIKKILFIIIPICTLMIAVSYGISIIFNNLELTYLYNYTYLDLTTGEEKTMILFRWVDDIETGNAGYLSTFTQYNNLTQPFINLGKSFSIITEPIKTTIAQFRDLNLENFFKGIGNIGITLVNIVVFILDIVCCLLQVIVVILGKLISIFGINVKANNPIFNVFRDFAEFTLINGIQPIV